MYLTYATDFQGRGGLKLDKMKRLIEVIMTLSNVLSSILVVMVPDLVIVRLN
jgi:hypothetical protein